MKERLESLIAVMPKGTDAALITSVENRFYFTGFSSSDGFLLVSENGCVFFTDSRYIEAAENKIKDCAVLECKDFEEQMKETVLKLKIKNLAIEAEKVTVGELKRLKKKIKHVSFSDDGELDRCISELRSCKSKEEIGYIKKAQLISELAFEHILGYIIPGMTERTVSLELDNFIRRGGAQDISFETIVVSGANSSMPHGVPSEKKIERGDFITMDFGAVWQGYHSDMTRTVAVGEVGSYQAKIYNIVLEAQEKALKAISAGVMCKDADEAARKVIRDAGFGELFGHGTGHGVGAEIHEKPNLSPKSEAVLKEGNVITVEPGIYLPGKFGVRIEDMAVVTANGCENLTKAEKKLKII